MPSTKPSTKKKSTAPATSEVAGDGGEPRVDLLDALQVGSADLEPLPVTLRGVDFSINRYYSPETIWQWADLQRRDTETMTAADIATGNRELLRIVIAEQDHDQIEALLAIIDERSVPEARRIFQYINNLAGLVDRQGNPLAL